MKRLLILLSILAFSFNSFGKWDRLEGVSNNEFTYYVHHESVKTVGEYVHFWDLTDNSKPTKGGILSVKIRKQGDCNLNRVKPLSFIFYKQHMGKGSGDPYTPKDSEWHYNPPESVASYELSYVCTAAKLIVK